MAPSKGLAITDPLTKYTTLVATGVLSPDPSQHRLALHLQKLYSRLKDYSPPPHPSSSSSHHFSAYNPRSSTLPSSSPSSPNSSSPSPSTSSPPPSSPSPTSSAFLAIKSHPIWRNPLFTHLSTTTTSSSSSSPSLSLALPPNAHRDALAASSPQGLFLSGPVGTGKSLLLDLLCSGLPTRLKRRWHFHAFMLYVLSHLNQQPRSDPSQPDPSQPDPSQPEPQSRSSSQPPPQPPRRPPPSSLPSLAQHLAGSSPLLFLDDFQLPDRASSRLLSRLLTLFFQRGGVLVASSNRVPEDLDRAAGVDYAASRHGGLLRRLFASSSSSAGGDLYGEGGDFARFLDVLRARCEFWHLDGDRDWRRKEATFEAVSGAPPGDAECPGADDKSNKPHHYHLSASAWNSFLLAAPRSWTPSQLTVYGRPVVVPAQQSGHALWSFSSLMASLGPADYLSLASNHHTFYIHSIPVLTSSLRNEARRFITLLDALYESRCKLFIQAAAPPDDLFFPAPPASPRGSSRGPDGGDDAVYPETISDVYQDSTAPFRPNVSSYKPGQDFNDDDAAGFGVDRQQPDFGDAAAFTGEDERFAYKRAASRLWEMCSLEWHARTGDWWQPLPRDARHWEGGPVSQPFTTSISESALEGNELVGEAVELDAPVGLERFRIDDLRRKAEAESRD